MPRKKNPNAPNAPRGRPFVAGNDERREGRDHSREGSENKLTKQCKEMIATCFENIGGAKGLEDWARDNRTAFYTRMYIRLLGIDITIQQERIQPYETVEQVNERLGQDGLTVEMLLRLREYEESRPKLIEHVRID